MTNYLKSKNNITSNNNLYLKNDPQINSITPMFVVLVYNYSIFNPDLRLDSQFEHRVVIRCTTLSENGLARKERDQLCTKKKASDTSCLKNTYIA